MARVKVMLSVAEDTAARLKQYAKDHHTTVSQAVTDWVWSVEVSEPAQEVHAEEDWRVCK